MDTNKTEVAEVSKTQDRAEMEAFVSKYAAKGRKVSIVCGAIVEVGEPTGSLNLRFRDEQIGKLALAMRAAKGGF